MHASTERVHRLLSERSKTRFLSERSETRFLSERSETKGAQEPRKGAPEPGER
jgi:hypothetical protein